MEDDTAGHCVEFAGWCQAAGIVEAEFQAWHSVGLVGRGSNVGLLGNSVRDHLAGRVVSDLFWTSLPPLALAWASHEEFGLVVVLALRVSPRCRYGFLPSHLS